MTSVEGVKDIIDDLEDALRRLDAVGASLAALHIASALDVLRGSAEMASSGQDASVELRQATN